MAKKKPPTDDAPAPELPALLVTSTADLAGDGDNPRKISEESSAGLRQSIRRFGDLSGIVFNTRTGELVAGHQRMKEIRGEYGDRAIELVDQAAGLYGIRIDESHYFPVRVVDWSQAKQRAANVAANNPKIAGTFTGELSAYLLSVEAELTEEMPGVLADCLLVELMSAGLDTTEATEEAAPPELEIESQFQIVIECESEDEQRKLFERFDGEGLRVKVLTV